MAHWDPEHDWILHFERLLNHDAIIISRNDTATICRRPLRAGTLNGIFAEMMMTCRFQKAKLIF